jgi:hypothetical protein
VAGTSNGAVNLSTERSQKWLTTVTGASHSHVDIQRVHKGGQTMPASELLDFAPPKYKRPQTEGLPVAELTALAPSDGREVTAENLDQLLDQVFENSTGEINSVIDEFERLRRKLKTEGESIKREIEEHRALSQQVMELTKTISGSMEKVRASVDR